METSFIKMMLVAFAGLLCLVSGLQCLVSAKYPIKNITNTVQRNKNQDNPCSGKSAGIYLIPDVFKYLKCEYYERGSYEYCCDSEISCKYQTLIFDSIYGECRDSMVYNLTNFCIGKANGQYRNPWNCNGFISCSNSISYDMPCPTSELVFDPDNNLCVDPSIFPCQILSSPCLEKGDGKYLISNVFAYLQCSSQQGSYVNCPDNQIFDPTYDSCKNADDYNLNNFCFGKPIKFNAYRNPWNCHSVISCNNRMSLNHSCESPNFTYDPYTPYKWGSADLRCKHSIFPCRTLNTSNTTKSICLGKPDGAFLIPDVFAYLRCKSEQADYYGECQANQIFDPIYSLCRDAGVYNFKNFCMEKPDGHYRNPWNCHSFISCLSSISHNVSCSIPESVYDPYNNLCVNSSFSTCKVLDNRCAGKADGKYLISDVFGYLQCSSQQGSYVNCSDNQIFDPRYSNCMDAKGYNLINFCIGKFENKNFRNPWNCHSRIRCLWYKGSNNSCEDSQFYDPYSDMCIDSSHFPCRTVISENLCLGKPDGAYLIPDMFAYLICQKQEQAHSLGECFGNQTFDPTHSHCRDAGLYSLKNFCEEKPDGHYRNPWNCHSFISCLNRISYNVSCATPESVYDPYFDVCEDSSIFKILYPCTALDNPCAGKVDGNNLIQDVFAYLQCSSQQGSYVNCPDNQIFDPRYSNCRDAKDYSFNNFCIGKITGDAHYRNPWNCHSSIQCIHTINYFGERDLPTNISCKTAELVYDPYLYNSFSDRNICEYPSMYPCRTLNTSENLCLGKPDGAYLIPDVFAYLKCRLQEQVGNLAECKGNQIFDPIYSHCRDAMLYSLKDFCVGKPDGHYRNPWNCHSFISCLNSISDNVSCAEPELVYDPYFDVCEDSSIYPCKVIDNPCAGKVDGNHLIQDVFAYLKCSSQQGSYVNCPDNQIFDQRYSDCMDAIDYDFNNFCIGKIQNTNYRNPWNCHSWIRCQSNKADNNYCQDLSLFYDPYSDLCIDSSHFPCRTVNMNTSICLGKPDGNYLIPDVFEYITCLNQEQFRDLQCERNEIFDPKYSVCRDGGFYSLKNFCVGKPDGHYRNPWNCHSLISCLNSVSNNVSCAIPEFVYDPYFDVCENSSYFDCKVLENPCKGKADGKYLIQDVFAYLHCSSQQGSYVNCSDNQIFDPRYSNCRDAKDYNFNNFCVGKITGDGQYRNPWNCHTYISCMYGVPMNLSCNKPELVFDPYILSPYDICEDPSSNPCRTINLSESICLGKPYGAYLIPDVFAYLMCDYGWERSLEKCPNNQIFDPVYSECRDAGLYSLQNFCVKKSDGHYRNPWNCHSFISCSNSISYNVSCAKPESVYDPYFDVCEDSSMFKILYPCTALDTHSYDTRSHDTRSHDTGSPDKIFVEDVVM